MKSLTMVAAVIALSTVVTSPVRAEKISVVGFKAVRFRGTAPAKDHIYLSAKLTNNSAAKTTGGRYKLYQANGAKMVEVASRNLNDLDPGNSELVGVTVPFSVAEHRFEIKVIHEKDSTSAKTTLAEATMKLRLISLKCHVTEDSGADECELRIYGIKESKLRRDMNTGDKWELNKNYKFKGSVTVQLWELDSPDADDKLGGVIIPSEPGTNDYTFKGDGARYVLKYEVVDE